jgi:hypothetical protein
MTTGPTTAPTTGKAHPRTARLALVLALSASLALSGCSGGSDHKAKPSPSPSASSSPSASTATPKPEPEKAPSAPKAKRGKAGQKVFARYVMGLWGYGLRTNDAKPLVALSPPKKPCGGCKAFARSLKKRHRQGWTVDFPGLQVRKITTKKVGDNAYAKATVDIPETDSYNSDGSFRNTNKQHKGASFEMLMHFKKKRYRLLAFTVS